MDEGCSPCACGVPGACDQLYFPGFLWPGVAVLIIALLALVFFSRKKIIRVPFRILLVGWLVSVLAFAGIVYLNIDSAGDRTQRAAEHCRASGDPACEY